MWLRWWMNARRNANLTAAESMPFPSSIISTSSKARPTCLFPSNVKASYAGDCFPSVEIMKKLAGPGYATVIAKSNLDPLAMVASSCAESTLSP